MKFKFAIASLAFAMLQGCASGFETYYKPYPQKSGSVTPLEPSRQPEVEEVSPQQINPLFERYFEDGWVSLGSSSFSGSDGSSSQAQAQAKSIGAHKVLYSYSLQGTSTASLPMTAPTVSYTNGTVTSGGAYGSYSGTTYGTSTTYVPISVNRYNFLAVYISPSKYKPILGVQARRKSAEEQKESGNINGFYIELVLRNSPAAIAGILPGDTILKLDGKLLDDLKSWYDSVQNLAGKNVDLELIRKGVPITVSLTLGKLDDPK